MRHFCVASSHSFFSGAFFQREKIESLSLSLSSSLLHLNFLSFFLRNLAESPLDSIFTALFFFSQVDVYRVREKTVEAVLHEEPIKKAGITLFFSRREFRVES